MIPEQGNSAGLIDHELLQEVGVQRLVPQVPLEDALALVSHFFELVIQEDVPALSALLDPSAQWCAPNRCMPALSSWQARLNSLDYRSLVGQPVLDSSTVEVTRGEELSSPAYHSSKPQVSVGPGALLVRVPVVSPRVGLTRYFGDEIDFVLHSDHGRLRVESLWEDFTPP